jgi:SAM-dependent methyltransferase
MTEYVLDHHNEGERARLALMSRLLDPMHRRHLEALGVGPGARALEVGCGNGSVSAWLAGRVRPGGQAVAVDIDLSLCDADAAPGLEFRQGDIIAAPVEPADFDVVTARAVLHHLADPAAAISNLVASGRGGGAFLLIEPDFLPVSIAEPPAVRAFWQGWLAWSREAGIDFFIGRKLPAMLADLELEDISAVAETPLYDGGSAWARYWMETVAELRPRLEDSGHLDRRSIDTFLAHCDEPDWWTQSIAWTAVHARKPATGVLRDTAATPSRVGMMKKLFELLVCFLHPIAVVLMWIDLATRPDMGRGTKIVWAIFGIIPLVPFLYVLTGGDLW